MTALHRQPAGKPLRMPPVGPADPEMLAAIVCGPCLLIGLVALGIFFTL